MTFSTQQQDEIKPWQKELIVSLFKRQKILRVLFVIFLLPAIALFFWFLSVGVNLYSQNKQALAWIQIPCEIKTVKQHWEAKENPYGVWDPSEPGSESDRYAIHFEIQYQYIYEDKVYAYSRYSIPRYYKIVVSENFSTDSKFETGQRTVCYVDPEKPSQSVLVRSSLSVSDYALHMFWSFVVCILYSIIPAFIYKKYNDDKKQLSELITGKKENILEDMNRMLDPLEDEDNMLL